jgi:hypothetical protein
MPLSRSRAASAPGADRGRLRGGRLLGGGEEEAGEEGLIATNLSGEEENRLREAFAEE